MAGSINVARRVLLPISLVLMLAGGWVAFAEGRPYFQGGAVDSERFAALGKGKVDLGLSIASDRMVLDNCFRTIVSLHERNQLPTLQRNVATTCLEIADRLTDAVPASSYGWYIGALAAQWLGDIDGALRRLLHSQQTGPNEQWIAERRIAIAEANLDGLTPELLANHERDLRMLVASARGIASIANRYVQEAGFRERITLIVESMPTADQRRFIGTLRSVTDRPIGL